MLNKIEASPTPCRRPWATVNPSVDCDILYLPFKITSVLFHILYVFLFLVLPTFLRHLVSIHKNSNKFLVTSFPSNLLICFFIVGPRCLFYFHVGFPIFLNSIHLISYRCASYLLYSISSMSEVPHLHNQWLPFCCKL